MTKYIKWFFRVIVAIFILIIVLPVLAFLTWIGSTPMSMVAATRSAYRHVERDWWALEIDE